MSDTSLNKYLAQGDDAAEAGFTPDPVTGTTPEQAVLFVNSETPASPVLKWWDGANFVEVGGGSSGGNVNAGGTLTNNALVIGQGSTDVATTTTGTGVLTALGVNVGTDGAFVTRGGNAGTPSAIVLTNATSVPVNQATGDLPFANLTQIAGLSVLGVTGSSTADVAAITAGTDGYVLKRVSSSSLAFDAPPGFQLDYVEFTSPVSITNTTEATADTVVSSGSVSYNGSTAIIIEFFAPYSQPASSAGANLIYYLYEDTGSIGQIGQHQNPASASNRVPVMFRRRMTPSNASHTYSIRAARGVGNGSVVAGAGGSGNTMPGYIRITRA